ncbi:ABC transporter substrate-binding protein [Microbacterium mangrovi]|uniref:ABC transporter substrate-binding protein n=1 Tax=Microbacterium mangrovi TaxID=1348253 RepID=A0A0B2A8R7_9MICO|nr:ABC transporter substrate-binding protein [Microbacterium mangrovi]KHK99495.1 ABC transporter substrate-binding protein [Microbacterium mangrovi]
MRNRVTGAIAFAAAAALLLTGCTGTSNGGGSASPTSAKGGTLTILTQQTQINLDPAKSQNLAITTLGLLVRRLTTWDIQAGKDPKVVPDLATNTGVPSDGGKTWTYTLKSGLKFQDGTPITTADIKYGIERSFAPELSGGLSYHKSLLVGGDTYQGPYSGKQLASIETPNATTIVFHLKAPYGNWPWIASMPAFAPVPKAKDNPNTYTNNPVASGPYEVKSNQQGTQLTLVRNKYWNQDAVRTGGPDQIIYKESQDVSTSAQSLISNAGSAQDSFMADYLGAAQLNLVNQNADAKSRLVTSKAGPINYLAINTTRGDLKNLKVRQAINYAVDPKAFIIAQGGNQAAIRATTLITPGIPGRVQYDLYPAGEDGNVAKAKALLSEAGVSSLNLTLWTQNDASSQAQAEAIQQGLKRAGITVTIKPMDSNTFYTEVTTTNASYDLALSSWQPDFPSAAGNIQPLFASDQIGNGGFNLSHYNNPNVDKLIDAAQATIDQSAADTQWANIDKKIMEDAPIVPLTYARQSFLRGGNVQNFFVASFPAYPNYLKVTLAQ